MAAHAVGSPEKILGPDGAKVAWRASAPPDRYIRHIMCIDTELEQACGVALKALTAGEQIRSARCVNYLREFGQHPAAVGSSTAAAEFGEQARNSRLWRIAMRQAA
jgi:hypothetical protein